MKKLERFSPVIDSIRRRWQPPVFPGDEDKSRLARVFHAIVVGTLITLGGATTTTLLFGKQKPGSLVFILGSGAVVYLLNRIMRQGRVRLAAGGFMVYCWIMASISVVLSGGLFSTASSLYVPVMAIAALFLGGRASIISAGFSLAFLLGIAVLDNVGVDFTPWFLLSPMGAWIVFVISSVLVLIPLISMQRELLLALRQAREQILEREKTEAALRISEAKSRLISSLTSDYTYSVRFKADGSLEPVVVSGAFETITGYSPDEFTGMGGWRKIVHPDDLVQDDLDMARLGENRQIVSELRIVRKDGGIRWVRTFAHPVWDDEQQRLTGINGAVQDITESHLAEQALRENEVKFRTIFELSPYSITIQSQDGTFLAANQAFLDQFGFTVGQVLGQTPISLGMLADPDVMQTLIQEMAATGRVTDLELPVKRADGTLFSMLTSSQRVEMGGEAIVLTVGVDITERKRAEQALAESEQRYRVISSLISDYAYAHDITPEGSLAPVWITEESFTRLTGYTWAEVGSSFRLYHPDDVALAQQHVAQSLQGQGVSGDYRIVTKTGELRWIHIDRQVEWDAQHQRPIRLYGAAQDITARRRAEQQLQEERRLLRDLIDHLPDLVFVKDLEGRFRVSNVAHTRIVGCSKEEEIIGKTSVALYPLALAEAYVSDDQWVFESGETLLDREEPFVGADGQSHWLLTTKIPMHDHRGQLTGLIGISRDITDRKKAEALLREREEALRQLNTQLEQRVIDRTAQLESTNRELEAFAYSVSHDLRTPLRSIDGFSQALLEDYHTVLADEGQEFLRRIRASTQRMGGMIDGLLTLSRIARSELRVQPLNLSSMAVEVAAQLAEAEPDRQVEVLIQPNMMVNGDTRLMRIALQNLLENAWKYTRQQPHPRVEVRAQARGRGEMVFSVSDNGAGFDMAYAEKLFGAFQRLHTQSEFPGHGIGLATVQRIIHRHGGRIWAQARLGEGATFYFTL